jgi:hypothetical protein
LAGLNFSGMDASLLVPEEKAFFWSTLDEMQKHKVPLAQLYEKLLTMNHLMVAKTMPAELAHRKRPSCPTPSLRLAD